ncbi:hypothetical protein PAXINDRAFT_172871 [Paxillus involutus ATCC 200175]|uniref:DUF1479-domain-containing protein n=1 Tax=Paxillus involutus ATCC 200175 TaxID=664439 RepID=A0A0C9SZC2_PAXIN|nr:hypothetical protein PAXINDRAFT_172871 [Paxillus involutus ATCC 200175]
MATQPTFTPRVAKEEGTIADIFTTLGSNADTAPLPPRFGALKKEVLHDLGATPEALRQAWNGVLKALEGRTEEIITKRGDIIPRIKYADVEAGLSEAQRDTIRKTGVVIVTGGVPKEEALAWKASIKDYIAANPVKGFPAGNIQAYEIYNTKPQIYARTHPAVLNTQKALLSLWHNSNSPSSIDFTTPISYFDRLRIRTPGDRSFTLGPHIDGGSVERWEDTAFRRVWGKILQGGPKGWESFDPFDASRRVNAKQDLYNTPNQCTILRCWQGWTSMSSTGVNEGTLRVLPMLSLATAYIILRPFFKPRAVTTGTSADQNQEASGARQSVSLAQEDWELNLDGSEFPGSVPGKTQELNEVTHPHLRLAETMVSSPRIEPGDQVYWHCDTVHAVEGEHKGKDDSSVLYIPAAPLSVKNAAYLRDQRINFVHGLPAPDFPGGEGESKFSGRATPQDITTRRGRQAMGFEPFVASGSDNAALVKEANRVLFG